MIGLIIYNEYYFIFFFGLMYHSEVLFQCKTHFEDIICNAVELYQPKFIH